MLLRARRCFTPIRSSFAVTILSDCKAPARLGKSPKCSERGWPSSAGGKLVGSLVGLPYALAEAEQNFLIPSREQALIWGDLVPQLLLSATVQRWWNVTPGQLHWVALHMTYARNHGG